MAHRAMLRGSFALLLVLCLALVTAQGKREGADGLEISTNRFDYFYFVR